MSREIEEKVVEMRFDNKNFEKNAAESMNTIEKLKKALNFNNIAKGINVLTNSVNNITFKKLGDAVDTIASKFSALEVAERAFITNLTNTATDAGKRLVKSLTLDQVSAAFQKYTDKTSYVQTIMNSTGDSIDKVNKYLDKLMWFSDETSYSFTDMTQALGQFTSAGADVKKVVPMITGIANATAYAGKTSAEFSRVLYNLNQSYSAGALNLMDWKSVELAGVATEQLKNALIEAGIAAGTLSKEGKTAKGELVTIANFSSTLNEKWATTEVMEKAFGSFSDFSDAVYKAVKVDKLYDEAGTAIEELSGQFSDLSEKAFKSAQQAKSFTEAIDATKDAVSSGWMSTFEIIFGNIEEATELWSELTEDLWELFAAGDSARNELFTDAFRGTSGWVQLQNAIAGTGIPIDNFKEQLIKTARTYNESIDDMIAEAGSFENSLQEGWLTTDIVEKTMNRYIYAVGGFADYTKVAAGEMVDLETIVNKVLNHELGDGIDQIHAIENAGYDAVFVQDLVSKALRGETIDYENLSKAQVDNLGYNREQIIAMKELAKAANNSGSAFNEAITNVDQLSGRDLLIDSFRNALESMITVNDIFKESFSEAFNLDSDALYGIIDAIHNLSTYLTIDEEHAEYLKSTFKGLFAIFDIIGTTIKTGVTKGFALLKTIIGDTNIDILKFTGSIGDSLQAFAEFYKSGDLAGKAFDFISENILKAISSIKKLGSSFTELPFVQNILSKIVDLIDKFKSVVTIDFDEVSGAITKIDVNFDKIGETISAVFDSVSTRGKEFENNITNVFDAVQTKFIAFGTKFIDFFKYIGESIKKINFYPIIAAAFTVGFLTIIKKALDVIRIVEDFGDRIISIIEDIGKATAAVKRAQAFKTTASGILIIAASIGILAASLALLAKVDDGNGNLNRALISLGIATAVVVAASALLSLTSKLLSNVRLRNAATTIISLSASLLVLVGALKIVSNLSKSFDNANGSNALSEGLTIIVKLLMALTGSALLIGAIKGDINKSALSIVAFAIAIRILIRSIGLISNDTIDTINDNTAAFIALAAALAGLMLATKNFSGSAGLGFVGISSSLMILVAAMKMLRTVDSGSIAAGITCINSIIIAFGLMMKLIGNSGENASKIGLGFAGMAAAIGLLVPSIYVLGKMSKDTLTKGSIVVGGLLTVFGLVMAFTKDAGQYATKAGAMLLMMSGAMVALTGLVAVLGSMDRNTVIQGTAAVVLIEGMLGHIVSASTFSEHSSKALGKIFWILTLLNGVLIYITKFEDPNKALVASAAISLLMLSLGETFKLISKSKDFKMDKNKVSALLMLTTVASVLGLVVTSLSHVFDKATPDKIITISLGISAMVVAMGKALNAISHSKDMTESNVKSVIKTLGALTLFAAALGTVVMGLSSVNTGNDNNVAKVIAYTVSLSGLMIALAGALRIIAGADIKDDINKSYKPMIALSGLAIAMTSVVSILSNVAGDSKKAISVAGSMSLLLLALAGCVKLLSTSVFTNEIQIGGLVKTLATLGVAASLLTGVAVILAKAIDDTEKATTVAKMMAGLMIALSVTAALASFAAKGIDPGSMTAIATFMVEATVVVAAIIALFGSINSLMKDLTGGEYSLTYFVEQFNEITTAIGDGIGKFFYAMTHATTETQNPEQVANEYAQQLVDAGDAITQFSETIGNTDLSNIENAKDYIKALADVESAIATTGGFKGRVFGETKWSTLSTGLTEFADAMISFSDTIGDKDLSNINTIQPYITSFSEALNKIPTDTVGTLGGYLFGDTPTWKTLYDGLDEFADAMISFSDKIGDTDLSNISTVTPYINSFSEALKSVPRDSTATFNGFLFGDTPSWKTVYDGLEEMATGIKVFVNALGPVKSVDLHTALSNLRAFTSIEMPREQTWFESWSSGKKDWSAISEGLPSLGMAINSFATSALSNGINAAQLNLLVKNFQTITGLITNTVSLFDYYKGFSRTFSDIMEAFAVSIVAISNTTKEADTEGLKKFVDSLTECIRLMRMVKEAMPDIPKRSDVTLFSDIIIALGNSLSNFSKGFSDTVDLNEINKFANTIIALMTLIGDSVYDVSMLSEFSDSFAKAGDLGIAAFIHAVTSKDSSISDAANHILEVFVAALNDGFGDTIKTKFDDYGKETSDSFGDGFDSKKESMKDAIIATIEYCIENSMSIVDKFKALGQSAAEGFANGMNDGANTIMSGDTTLTRAIKKLKNTEKKRIRKDTAIPTRANIGQLAGNAMQNIMENGIIEGVAQTIGDITGVSLNPFDSLGDQISDGIIGPIKDDMENLFDEFQDGIELPDITDVTESYEEQLKRQKKLLTQAKQEFDNLFNDYKNGRISQMEYDQKYTEMLTKYSEVQEELVDHVKDKVLPVAKKEYDKLIKDYKNGRISQMEYDQKYTDLLSKNTVVQAEMFDYANEKIRDVVQTKFDKITTNFEKELSDIQSDIDNFVSKNTGTLSSQFTHKTNKDIYDETVQKYSDKNDNLQKEIDKYNEKISKSIELWGENNSYVRGYEQRISTIEYQMKKNNDELEKYKENYTKSGVKDDDIIETMFPSNEEMDEKINKVNEYATKYRRLQNRNVSQVILDAVTSKDEKEAIATMDYLLSKTDKELLNMSNKWDEYTSANEGLANLIYNPKIETATANYRDEILSTLSTIPESAYDIGVEIAENLTDGLSDATASTLSRIGLTTDDISKSIERSLLSPDDPNFLQNALKTIADVALNMLKGAFSNVNVDKILKPKPTQNGLQSISVLGDYKSASLTDPYALYTKTAKTGVDIQESMNDSYLIKQIDALNTTVNSILQENSNQQILLSQIVTQLDTVNGKVGSTDIVLDTGTLVGSMIDKVDRAMGKRNLLRSRGG